MTQICYPRGFLSSSSISSFPNSSAYIFNYISNWRALLEGLYLFTLYALQYYKTFRNSYSYLGIWILTIHRFRSLIIYNITTIDGNHFTSLNSLYLPRSDRNIYESLLVHPEQLLELEYAWNLQLPTYLPSTSRLYKSIEPLNIS